MKVGYSTHSTAIDYTKERQLQEKQAPVRKVEAAPKKKAKRQSNALLYFKYVVIYSGVFALLLAIVMGNIKVTELTKENSAMKKELSQMESDAAALNAKKEQMYNLAYVEQYAKSVLGMVKLEKSEIIYVELSNPEKITVVEKDNLATLGAATDVGKAIGTIVEYLD